jgi:dihydroorotate dehydrogenase electron transfer subunit
MRQGIFQICEHIALAPGVFRLDLAGDCRAITAPGQFANLALPGFYLRRPISVCDWDDGGMRLIYKVVGDGTNYLSGLPAGTELDALTGLGNGYAMEKAGAHPLLIGGGVGVPPLYGLAKRLLDAGRAVTVILGFNTESEIFYLREFQALGAEVRVTTADGSFGTRGFVTDAMGDVPYTYFYACGPEPMLKAVYDRSTTSGQLSFEERMGCGFGACMGCSCETKYGAKRICRDGPVLEKEEVIW